MSLASPPVPSTTRRSPSPRLLPLLFVVLLLRCSPVASQSTATVQDVVVLNVTGCIDQLSVTVNCSIPSTVLVYTAGLPSPSALAYPNVRFQSAGKTVYTTRASWNRADRTLSSLLVLLQPQTYSAGLTGGLLTVTIFDAIWGNASKAFPALSFAPLPAPSLTSIGGCQGSGSGTYGCAPDSDVLTIQGVGLTWLQQARLQIGAPASGPTGSSGTTVLVSGGLAGYPGASPRFTLVNDSYALVQLNQSYQYSVLPQHYNGTVLPVSFSTMSYDEETQTVDQLTTNALNISFVPLPPPSIASVYVTQCAEYSGAHYTDCLPGVSYLTITGHYLYLLQMAVAGQPCTNRVPSSTSSICVLPVIASYTPGLAYDVVLVPYNSANVTLAGVVAFTSAPTISSVISCVNEGPTISSTRPLCKPGGVLTVKGSRFPSEDPAVQVTMTRRASSSLSFSVNCTAATVVDSATIACTLPLFPDPAVAAQFYGQYLQLQASFSSAVSNTLFSTVYDYPDAPNVTAVSGCSLSVSALATAQCLPEDVLVIEGTNLAGSSVWVYGVAQVVLDDGSTYTDTQWCNVTTASSSASSITCLLPQLDDQDPLLSEVDYFFLVYLVRNNDYMQSNAFRVSFSLNGPSLLSSSTGAAPSGEGESGNSGLSGGAITGLVIALIAVVAVVVVAIVPLVRRRRKASGQHGDDSLFARRAAQGDRPYNDLELQ